MGVINIFFSLSYNLYKRFLVNFQNIFLNLNDKLLVICLGVINVENCFNTTGD